MGSGMKQTRPPAGCRSDIVKVKALQMLPAV
jgi:hypothetical protein